MSIAAGDDDPIEIDARVELHLALNRLGEAQVALALANAENENNVRNGLPPPHSTTEMQNLFTLVRTSLAEVQHDRFDLERGR